MEKFCVNYLFFGLFFAFIVALHGAHIYLIDYPSSWVKWQFFFHVCCQCFLEAFVLASCAAFLQKRAPRWIWLGFIGCTVVIFLLHCIEFFMVRLMDISIQYAIAMVLDESLENFMEMLYATHVPIMTWLAIVLGFSAAVLGGIFLYLRLHRWCGQYPLQWKKKRLALFGMVPFLLLVSPKEGDRELGAALPWKQIMRKPKLEQVQLEHGLKPLDSEAEMCERIGRITPISEKPDLFLFVVESLRADYINEEVAPCLHRFKQEAICPEIALASGNGTQLSWFSIFNAKFPFYFSKMEPKSWQSGSLGLQCLKQLGYQVHVFSSTRLSYYQMDKRVFGATHQLADSFSLFPAGDDLPAHECDRRVFEALELKAAEGRGGRCFLVFLESTHFDYSFPEGGKFTPYDEGINHAQLAFSHRGLEKVKNRYRNAIHYTDRLFGDFRAQLRKLRLWDEAVVVVTGDHGEEFYENGHLFHASNLNRQQVHVPLYFKFGSLAGAGPPLSSHIDIFPSLLHYLLKDTALFGEIFDGESILQPDRGSYAVTGRFNGARDPYEFLIRTAEGSFIAQFKNRRKIFDATAIQILEMDGQGVTAFTPAFDLLTDCR